MKRQKNLIPHMSVLLITIIFMLSIIGIVDAEKSDDIISDGTGDIISDNTDDIISDNTDDIISGKSDAIDKGKGRISKSDTKIQESTAGLTSLLYNVNIKGGYTANGVGMRNRGWGTILIKDIPSGSKVEKAYLFWSIIGSPSVATPPSNYASGKINGISITGTYIGSADDPCWNAGKIFGYRADVTSIVTANRLYHLQNFATGYIWGDEDPWTYGLVNRYPLLEGASLVVIYSNSKYPTTNIQIKQGVETFYPSSSTTFTGFAASGLPVAKTTFILSDGQKGGDTEKFNNIVLPSNFADGIDRQNGNDYSDGNLQDTNTAFVVVNKFSTSATASIDSSGDCLTWLAQVFSIYDGNIDTDGDALKDAWETYGYDYGNDGSIDVNLPALGSNPFHKDLFVEIDWMANSATETVSHYPDPSVVSRSIDTFAKAPYANNPDGKTGINMHIDVSNQVAHDDLISDWNEFDIIKNANFAAARRDIYHYALFGHNYWYVGSSGISRGIPASDFMVTLGGWPTNPGTADEQTGTFIHEFGHNLGLTHGGNDHNNYKPNYLSIMNYLFQTIGVYRSGKWGNFDYQRTTPYILDENNLNESKGIGTYGYGTKWFSPGCTMGPYGPTTAPKTSTVYKPIDWNWNGNIQNSVAVDINCDQSKTTLNSQNNWQNIIYNGGSVGGIGPGIKIQIMKIEDMPPELTYEESKKISNMK